MLISGKMLKHAQIFYVVYMFMLNVKEILIFKFRFMKVMSNI